MTEFPAEVFRAYDIRGLVETQITPDFAFALGKGLGERIGQLGGGAVSSVMMHATVVPS